MFDNTRFNSEDKGPAREMCHIEDGGVSADVRVPETADQLSDRAKVPASKLNQSSSQHADHQPTAPRENPNESFGGKGEVQTGKIEFAFGAAEMPDKSDNRISTLELIVPSTGEATDKPVAIMGQGIYTLRNNGTITFAPEGDFVGDPQPVGVIATDKLGQSAKTTYQPHVVNNTATKTVVRIAAFTFLTPEGEEAAKSVEQTAKFELPCTVNPCTGAISEPNWTKAAPKEFNEVPAPAVNGWTPDRDVIPAAKVWATDADSIEYAVYNPAASIAPPVHASGSTPRSRKSFSTSRTIFAILIEIGTIATSIEALMNPSVATSISWATVVLDFCRIVLLTLALPADDE